MKINLEKLKKILDKVDLTQTQRNRATELYTNVCNAIEEKSGLDISFYPQGSFATKTAIRPYKNGRDQAYDVDVICEVNSIKKELVTPDQLKGYFRDALRDSRYSNKMKEWDKCFTITFEEQDGVNFSIDIIPSVSEDASTKKSLFSVTDFPFLVDSSVAIPNTQNCSWLTNNPKGYVKWFEDEIETFHKSFLLEKRAGKILASVEELPDDELDNMLLSVVKVLKRTRDVFYYRRKSDGRPASIIITTIVGKLAKNLHPTSNELDLLRQVIDQLQQLKGYPVNESSKRMDATGYAISDIITRDNGRWEMNNPANGKDNLLNSWNEEKDKAKDFFAWVENLQSIFLTDYESDQEEERVQRLYNAFAVKQPESPLNKPQFSVSGSSTKPWRTR
ncbi:nucleotidyltransferase [Enterococcus avium]|uniref:nucleotidyltransferase domain-containing protein n=1 Tax=Enterococcus avium TaxID=33945 RepID=UPI0028901AD4|nr:nucleotidyltransferase [Enterococcus avium]MDT2502555.1 nucleotidyltransferase [Enterococcus avium]